MSRVSRCLAFACFVAALVCLASAADVQAFKDLPDKVDSKLSPLASDLTDFIRAKGSQSNNPEAFTAFVRERSEAFGAAYKTLATEVSPAIPRHSSSPSPRPSFSISHSPPSPPSSLATAVHAGGQGAARG